MNYYQATKYDSKEKFVSHYKILYCQERMTGNPIEAAYNTVYMWAMKFEKARSFDIEVVRVASKGLSFYAPEGLVSIEGSNQYLYKNVKIGKINSRVLIDEVWSKPSPIKADPYLSMYQWVRGL